MFTCLKLWRSFVNAVFYGKAWNFVLLFEQILMNVKSCLDFAKEGNVLIHLVVSSVSVHQGTIWTKRLVCAMVRSLHLTRLLLLLLENDGRSICRINLSLKRNITRPSSVKLKSGEIGTNWSFALIQNSFLTVLKYMQIFGFNDQILIKSRKPYYFSFK